MVVTGVGAVSPLGIGREALWKRAHEGGVARLAGERLDVEEFDVAAILRTKGIRYIGRGTRLLASASRLALEDAHFGDPAELGFAVGSAFGNTSETFSFTHRTLTEGVGEVLPMASFDAALNSQANYTAVYLEAQRFTRTFCGMTASLEAVADVASVIRAGRARAGVAAGMDYWNPELEEWLRHGAVGAARPIAEGAYALVLEEAESAVARGAPALAEIGGSARGFDLGEDSAELQRRLAEVALAGERAAYRIDCGSPGSELEGLAPLEVSLPNLVGDALGARGALGTALAALSLSAGLTLQGLPLPAGPATTLVTDFQPDSTQLCLAVRRPEAPA